MKTEDINIHIEFTEPLLATASGNKDIQEEFIASRAPDVEKTAEELEALPAVPIDQQVEKASTVFHRDEKGLFLFDYHWRGHIKESLGLMCELGEFKKLSKWTFKRAVDLTIYVRPRRVYLMRDGKNIMQPEGSLQRPLRATTMQGDRVALARSELVNPGATCDLEIHLLASGNSKSAWSEITREKIIQAFTLGQEKGHGQWRGGGYGRYVFSEP